MNSEDPLIGIVVPAYNCERYLPATLQSIIEQTVSSWQCVVVDDGSKDGSLAVAQRFASQDSRFQAITQKNAGWCVARNKGLTYFAPSVKYVVFMDADDMWRSQALEKLRAAIDADPAAIGAHGLADFINAEGVRYDPEGFANYGRARVDGHGGHLRACPPSGPTNFAMVATVCKIVPPGLVLFHRHALDRIGGIDEQILHIEDFDFYIRLCRLGHLAFINEVILDYRRHPANGGSVIEDPKWRRMVAHKAFFSPDNTPEHRSILRDSWRALQREMAAARWQQARDHLREKRWAAALSALARLPIILFRLARGYPTLRGL